MKFSEAKREFDIRYYLWSISEFEKEIEESFPTLRLFKAGGAWKTYQFMLKLPKSEQLVLARSLVKRSHPNAVKTLGETCSAEEESLRSRRDAAFSNILSVSEEIRARKKAGEPVKLAGKRKLRKVMTAQFKAAFGSECIDLARADEDEEMLRFKMKRAGWFVTTSFYFGRSKPVLDYMHGIASEEPLIYREGIGPMVMGAGMSFNSCLGVSRSQWNYITDEEIEPTCDTVIELCAHFFEVLPKLLKGLECDNVVPDGADIRGF
ncbi:MAG TPA: hypothetical protein VN887_14925 [Candidatus Angelobacter sp.]|nr:hypothetical protein [Candidatus Angelobacter sp.]